MKDNKVELQGFVWSTFPVDLSNASVCPFCNHREKLGLVESIEKGLCAIACGFCGAIGPDSADGPTSALDWWNGELKKRG